MYTFYTQSLGFFLSWAAYYIYSYVRWLSKRAKDDTHFFTKAKSEYYQKVGDSPDPCTDYKINWDRVKVIMFRTVAQTLVQSGILATFWAGSKSGTNNGIIATIFTTQLLFSTAIFYFKYGQKVTPLDLSGIVLILLCVVSIGYGASLKDDSEKLSKEQTIELNEIKDD